MPNDNKYYKHIHYDYDVTWLHQWWVIGNIMKYHDKRMNFIWTLFHQITAQKQQKERMKKLLSIELQTDNDTKVHAANQNYTVMTLIFHAIL